MSTEKRAFSVSWLLSLVKPTKLSWNLLTNLVLKFHFLLLGALKSRERCKLPKISWWFGSFTLSWNSAWRPSA